MKKFLHRLSRRLRPPRRLRITREGKAFLLLTLGVGIAAVNTGNNLLYLALSANLALVTLSGFLSEWTLRRVSLSVSPASDPFAGTESLLLASCSAAGKRFPGLSLAASLRVQGGDLSFRIPDVPPGGRVSRVVRFVPASRGRVGTIPASLSTRFPFALLEKSRDLHIPAGWAVYPSPLLPGEWIRILLDTASEEDPRNAGRAGAFPRGAREHLPADPVRDIHWKATARAGRWMVKEREGESAPAGNVERHRWLSKRSQLRAEPRLRAEGLLGGARYFDAQCDDARLTLANARDAHRHGALVATYAEARGFDVAAGKAVEPPDFLLDSALTNIKDQSRLGQDVVVNKAKTSIATLSSQAMLGHVYSPADLDGKLRWECLYIKFGDDIYPSLSLVAAAQALGKTVADITVYAGRGVQVGDTYIPVEPAGRMRVDYLGRDWTLQE